MGYDRYQIGRGQWNTTILKTSASGPPPNHTIGKHEAYFPTFTTVGSEHIFLILKIPDHVKQRAYFQAHFHNFCLL